MSRKIYRAGLIPYIVEDNIIKLLFMKPSDPMYGGEQFQIAKGKVEEGESDMEAAIREATEELGLVEDNIDHLIHMGVFLGRTSFFIARVKDASAFVEPHFETAETRWMTLSEFQLEGRQLHQPIVQDAVRSIHLTT
jgi:8-oxo-dGTP pyrophosphatase MutT (NUDIX family)